MAARRRNIKQHAEHTYHENGDYDYESEMSDTADYDDFDDSDSTLSIRTTSSFDEDGFVHFPIPGFTFISGPSRTGKTTLVHDLFIYHRFVPMPVSVILYIGAMTVEEKKDKVTEFFKVLAGSMPELAPENVHVVNSCDHVIQILEKLDRHSPKVMFLDDAIGLAKNELRSIACIGAHHHNMAVLLCHQDVFLDGNKVVIDNASSTIIFPGFRPANLAMVLRSYDQPVKDRVMGILSQRGQNESNPLADREEGDIADAIRTPVIIIRDQELNPSTVRIYAGLFDSDPREYSTIPTDKCENPETFEKEKKRYIT